MLTDIRADVGLQWVMFSQCMGAARVMMNTIRVLQRLVGDVDRVNELLVRQPLINLDC